MIIRENDTAFVMIEQDHHANISYEIMSRWKDVFFTNDGQYASVMYAITNHDIGWRNFDKQPFWNGKNNAPYTFTDFPLLPKIVLYQHGLDEIEKKDAYAGVLCSAHYSRFMDKLPHKEAKEFILQEQKRRERLIATMPSFDSSRFVRHFELLRFADNVSLYICLNEPGVKKENEHPFFRNGIPLSREITAADSDLVPCYWEDWKTVVFRILPSVDPFSILLNQKVILKQTIEEDGLIASYEKATYIKKQIEFRME